MKASINGNLDYLFEVIEILSKDEDYKLIARYLSDVYNDFTEFYSDVKSSAHYLQKEVDNLSKHI